MVFPMEDERNREKGEIGRALWDFLSKFLSFSVFIHGYI